MNIFKALSEGHGVISETNITSFLSFLLSNSNELNNGFLLLLFDLIDENLIDGEKKIDSILRLPQNNFRERCNFFQKKYSVISEPEVAYKDRGDGGMQISDVLVKIVNRKDDQEVLYLLIENKIKTVSLNQGQVSKQYKYFTNSEEYQLGLPVYSLLLTIDHDSFRAMFDQGVAANPCTVWIKWTNNERPGRSIEGVIRELILKEASAEIQPINPNTQFILKSFIDYIVSEFSFKERGERNMSLNGAEVVEQARISIDNGIYVLKKFDNKMIRIFNEQDEMLDIKTLPFLKRIIEKYNYSINLLHPTGKSKKNTQQLGEEIIRYINSNSVVADDNTRNGEAL